MDSTLTHYGVKGMKWGIRRNRKKSNTKPKPKTSKHKVSLEDTVAKISKGKETVDKFVKRYGPSVVKTGALLGLSAVGASYLAPIASKVISDIMEPNIVAFDGSASRYIDRQFENEGYSKLFEDDNLTYYIRPDETYTRNDMWTDAGIFED